MRNHARHSHVDDLDTCEDKQIRNCCDAEQHHTDQCQHPYLFGLSARENWQTNQQKQAAENANHVGQERIRAIDPIRPRNKNGEQRREDRADGTSQLELALKTYGHRYTPP